MDFSVVLSTHDRPEILRAAVEAVLAQTAPPGELIVVHDGPGEVAPALAAEARRRGVPFRCERLSAPSLTASRNRGIDVAAGEVVVLLEDDVLLPPDYLSRLGELYRADGRGAVAGIGAVVVEPDMGRWKRRLWDLAARALGRGLWSPRRLTGRRVALPAALARRLVAARRLSGGGLSLRRAVAAAERFDEGLDGYALGEDREFCFRAGARHALFLAPELVVRHAVAPGGRPDPAERARMFVRNTLRIARRATEGGAGTWLLVGWELAGAVLLHLLAAPLSRRPGEKLAFAAAAAGELVRRAAGRARSWLCGS